RRGAADSSREIDRVGGYLNAFTDRDSICRHCQVPASAWRLAIDVLADMAFASRMDDVDFEKERDVIVSEIMSARDDPEECSHDALLAAIWPGDPLSLKIAGEPEDLTRATPGALRAFYRERFVPSTLLATVAGPVGAEEVAEALSESLERAAERSERTALPAAIEATPIFVPAQTYRIARMEQANYFEAVQLDPPYGEDDYYALAAVNGAIGEAASSRLFQSLRERRGLCYSVYSSFSLGRSECLWLASANVSPSRVAELARAMGDEIDAVAAGELTDDECADAITRLAGSFELSLDDPDFRMRRIARQIWFSGIALDEAETRSRIAALDPLALRNMASRLLAGRPRARFAYGRRAAAAAKALSMEERRDG
ncbi:MAG: pitrilysin family protein, partial [Spirochaetaceae bacterium]|nr:pitrilysin family protein [Spirochaetaceae bacterium]